MQDIVAAEFEEVYRVPLLELGLGYQDYLWAVEVLHSRCFFAGDLQQHLSGKKAARGNAGVAACLFMWQMC